LLIGNYSSTLSLKRRCAIPKKFLKELGSNLVVARWYENCLVLVGIDSWQALLKRLTTQIEMVSAPVRDTDRFILGSAYEIEPDFQGRVIIPSNLASYANLKTRLVFLGLNDRIEIWDEEAWKKREEYISQHAGEFIEKLAEGTSKKQK